MSNSTESSSMEEEEDSEGENDTLGNLENNRMRVNNRLSVKSSIRQTAIANPIMADAIRRTRLGMKVGDGLKEIDEFYWLQS